MGQTEAAHHLEPRGVVAAEVVADSDQGEQPLLLFLDCPLGLAVDRDPGPRRQRPRVLDVTGEMFALALHHVQDAPLSLEELALVVQEGQVRSADLTVDDGAGHRSASGASGAHARSTFSLRKWVEQLMHGS